jgi:heme exporter protein CcmD
MLFELGRHGGYILASYAAAVLILGALIFGAIHANRKARAALRDLEGRSGGGAA